MAENKKSFIAYCDWLELFQNLSNEEAGKLAKHLFNYVNDNNPKSDKLTELLFIQIKQSLKRDLIKYEQFVSKQRDNGALGGRPKKNPSEPKKPKPFLKNPSEPKKPDSVNDSVSVNESVINKKGNISLFEKTLNDFSVMRVKIKKPLTDRAKELLLMELNKLAPGDEEKQIKILEQSIFKSWQGVFELKQNIQNNNPIKQNPLHIGFDKKDDGIKRYDVMFDSDPKHYNYSDEEIEQHIIVKNTRLRTKRDGDKWL